MTLFLPHSAPHVLVTGPDKLFKFAWWATRWQLRRVGLRAFYTSPQHQYLPDQIDGLVIGGGDDIDPKHYGASGAAGSVYDIERDKLELKMIDLAIDAQIPMLGICRGAQLINVASGGTLIGDLRPLRVKTPNRNSILPIKNAIINTGTSLHDLVKATVIRINSLHNQAVDQVGEGLSAVAVDDDGFVQAVEKSGTQFVLGVQWHPEYMLLSKPQIKIFRGFSAAVRQRQSQNLNTDAV